MTQDTSTIRKWWCDWLIPEMSCDYLQGEMDIWTYWPENPFASSSKAGRNYWKKRPKKPLIYIAFFIKGIKHRGFLKKVSAFCCIYLINLRSSNNYIQLPSHFQGRKEISIGNLKSGSRFLKIKLFKSFEEAGGFVYKIYMMTCEMWEVKNL